MMQQPWLGSRSRARRSRRHVSRSCPWPSRSRTRKGPCRGPWAAASRAPSHGRRVRVASTAGLACRSKGRRGGRFAARRCQSPRRRGDGNARLPPARMGRAAAVAEADRRAPGRRVVLTSPVAAQGGDVGLSGWQVLAVFAGVPAAIFIVIALMVLRFAPKQPGAFPVLRPADGSEPEEPPAGDPVTAPGGAPAVSASPEPEGDASAPDAPEEHPSSPTGAEPDAVPGPGPGP